MTIGQTGVPNRACNLNDNFVQSATVGPPGYAVPAGLGVITSWSFRGTGAGKVVMWRPTGAANQFIVVGKSAAETFDPAVVKSYSTRIPVQPNDLLGMRMPGDGMCLKDISSCSAWDRPVSRLRGHETKRERPLRRDRLIRSEPQGRKRMATPEGRSGIGGISLGGILVIIGIVVMILWSFWIGLIVLLIGLIAFGGFARGRWY